MPVTQIKIQTTGKQNKKKTLPFNYSCTELGLELVFLGLGIEVFPPARAYACKMALLSEQDK